ncbi:MAG: AAA family ATPase, partial [Halalkalicoccus sp.]
AVKHGATLVYNEFSRTKPAAHNVLLSVFEEGVLDRPGQRGDERVVDVDPEFRAIFTSNSAEYAGVHRPQDALLDRFIGVHLGYYERETELAIVESRVDGLDDETVERIVDVTRDLRDRLDLHVGTRAAVMIGEGILAFGEDALVEICVDVLGSKAESVEQVEGIREEIEDVAG